MCIVEPRKQKVFLSSFFFFQFYIPRSYFLRRGSIIIGFFSLLLLLLWNHPIPVIADGQQKRKGHNNREEEKQLSEAQMQHCLFIFIFRLLHLLFFEKSHFWLYPQTIITYGHEIPKTSLPTHPTNDPYARENGHLTQEQRCEKWGRSMIFLLLLLFAWNLFKFSPNPYYADTHIRKKLITWIVLDLDNSIPHVVKRKIWFAIDSSFYLIFFSWDVKWADVARYFWVADGCSFIERMSGRSNHLELIAGRQVPKDDDDKVDFFFKINWTCTCLENIYFINLQMRGRFSKLI